jgi:5-methylcytosine-specific restriction protein A
MTTKRNPDWSRDELILALELYKKNQGNPAKDGREIVDLSALLNNLGAGLSGKNDGFRNANGVYMKVMNFRRFDEAYSKQGKKGLTRGNKLEEEVWNIFGSDAARLTATAEAIRKQLVNDDYEDATEEELVSEAEEGRLLTRVHTRRERNRRLIKDKKANVLKQKGRLACEVCDFEFFAVYGERGDGFIEVHHKLPVHTLSAGSKTRLEDLAVVCANCHRMIHAKSRWLGIEELRVIVSNRKGSQSQ